MDSLGIEIQGKPGTFCIDSSRLSLFRPHKYPMVLLEEVTECCLNEKWLKGIKHVRLNDPYVQANFPGNSFMPPSFVVEGLAQASGCLMNLMFFHDRGIRLWEIGKETFFKLEQPPYNVLAEAKIKQHALAMPGETLNLYARIALQRRDIIAFHTEATVADRVIASGEVILAYPSYTPIAIPQEQRTETTHVPR